MDKIDLKQAAYYSEFQKICVKIRCRGIKVDIAHLKKTIVKLEYTVIQTAVEIINNFKIHASNLSLVGLSDAEFFQKEEDLDLVIKDLDSPKKLGKALIAKGYKLPKTAAGGDSVSKEFLLAHPDDELIGLILKYRTYKKILNDFFTKILEMQEYTCPEALVEGATEGRVYPELNVFGAQTGRFSSSCPNIQQIPKRDPELGKLSRAIFLPETQWHSLDWSNQEGRLQVHYACAINAPGAQILAEEFKKNPKRDLHQTIADMTNIPRSTAKVINLGISYGMGVAKLAKSLKISEARAKKLISQYHDKAPYLQTLNKICQKKAQTKGYVQSLGGRKLRLDAGFDYKALNALIQGSAADQCLMALKMAYDEDINIISIVHDEFNIDGTLEDAKKMKHIMENCAKLSVPCVAELQSGKSWGDLE